MLTNRGTDPAIAEASSALDPVVLPVEDADGVPCPDDAITGLEAVTADPEPVIAGLEAAAVPVVEGEGEGDQIQRGGIWPVVWRASVSRVRVAAARIARWGAGFSSERRSTITAVMISIGMLLALGWGAVVLLDKFMAVLGAELGAN